MTKSYYSLNELSLPETEAVFADTFADYPYLSQLRKTYAYVKKAHGKQTRMHVPTLYVVHLLRICIILYKYHKIADLDMLQAALLHDVVEDTKFTQADIERKFNNRVASLVKTMTRIKPKNETPLQKFKNKQVKLKNTLQGEKELRILKAVDITDNMNDWIAIPKQNPLSKKIPRWLAEFESSYLPLAQTLGSEYVIPMEYIYKYLLKQGYQANYTNPEK